MSDNGDIKIEEEEEEMDDINAESESELDIKTEPGEDGKPVHLCEVCDIYLSNDHAYEMHLKGKGHLRALRLRKNFEVLTDSESMKIVDKKPNILPMLEEVDEPLIGLDYLIEFIHDEEEGAGDPVWVCTLCDSPLQLETLVKEHFIGKRHRYKYLSKHYKEMSKVVHAKDKNSDKSPLCMGYAQLVVDKEGKKFDSIKVAVNPNKSKLASFGQPPKKKPKSLMEINPGVPSLLTRGGGGFMAGPRGGMRGRMRGGYPGPYGMNRGWNPNYEPGYFQGPMSLADIMPLLESAPVLSMADRDCLIGASQILEQKLVEYNTYMGLDPYDGVGSPEQSYGGVDYTQDLLGTTSTSPGASSTTNEENSDTSSKKGPVSLMDIPSPAMGGRGWPSRGWGQRGWAPRGRAGYGAGGTFF